MPDVIAPSEAEGSKDADDPGTGEAEVLPPAGTLPVPLAETAAGRAFPPAVEAWLEALPAPLLPEPCVEGAPALPEVSAAPFPELA